MRSSLLLSTGLAFTATCSHAWLGSKASHDRGFSLSLSSRNSLTRSYYYSQCDLQNETSAALGTTTAYRAVEGWNPSSPSPSDLFEDRALVQSQREVSLERAMGQVDAILDLYNTTGGAAISGDLALSTLESVVFTCSSQSALHGPFNESLLDRLEALVWRFGECQIAPTSWVLDNLWNLQNPSADGRHFASNEGFCKASKHVGRRIHLLSEWHRWYGLGRVADPIPEPYLRQVLDDALERNLTASFAIWDLYRALHDDPSVALSRGIYTRVLRLLGRSSSDWKLRQCRVVQDMVELSQPAPDGAGLPKCAPTVQELEQVLQLAARAGRVQDASWILRLLPEVRAEHKLLFLRALARTKESGSILYMERLLEFWTDVGPEGCLLLLQKLSLARTPGQGYRARKFFFRMQESGRSESVGLQWKPSGRSIHLVVQAYLHNPLRNETDIVEAERFVRSCIEQGYLHEDSCSLLTSEPARFPWRVVDRILKAYSTHSPMSQLVRDSADDLFRFFLIQHRQGRLAEEPDQYHLGHVLRIWNRSPGGGSAAGAYKSLDYVRLYDDLRRRGTIRAAPDEFNLRQLLGTLARSDRAGFGDAARHYLERVVARVPDVRSPKHAVGHMFWCVVKCYCNEGTLGGAFKAVETLDRMEALSERYPDAVQVTGAAYQTILKKLSFLLPGNGGKSSADAVAVAGLAQEVVRRLERQSMECGNARARLTRNIYLDAIRCCKPLPVHEAVCASYRAKLAALKPNR